MTEVEKLRLTKFRLSIHQKLFFLTNCISYLLVWSFQHTRIETELLMLAFQYTTKQGRNTLITDILQFARNATYKFITDLFRE